MAGWGGCPGYAVGACCWGIMPKAMKQWCKAAGCSGEAVERGYCKACAGKRPQSGDAYRGSRHERGYGSRWEKLRMSVLRLSPGCVVWAACHRR